MSSSDEWKCPPKRAKNEDNGVVRVLFESSDDSSESNFKCTARSLSESSKQDKGEAFDEDQNLSNESCNKKNSGSDVISTANFVGGHISSSDVTHSDDSGSSIEAIPEDKEILESNFKNYVRSLSKSSKQGKSESFQQDQNLSNESFSKKNSGPNVITTANFVKGPVSSVAVTNSDDSASSIEVALEDKEIPTTNFFSGDPSSITLPRIQIYSSDEKTSPSSSDIENRTSRKSSSNDTFHNSSSKTASVSSKHEQTETLDANLQVNNTKLSLGDSENSGCSKALDISSHSQSNSFLQTDLKNSSEKNKRSFPSVSENGSSSKASSDDSSFEKIANVSSESSFENLSSDTSFENVSPEMSGKSKKKREFSPEY